jgi:hypothetical protein
MEFLIRVQRTFFREVFVLLACILGMEPKAPLALYHWPTYPAPEELLNCCWIHKLKNVSKMAGAASFFLLCMLRRKVGQLKAYK